MTTLTTRQVTEHPFLLTLLSSKRARKRSKLLDLVMAAAATRPDGEKTYDVKVSVNGIDLDFTDFTDNVVNQLDEMLMRAARKLLDEQFTDRFREVSEKLYDAERHAKDLRNALENEVRKAWGMSPRQDGG